jgi:hypothetical protein
VGLLQLCWSCSLLAADNHCVWQSNCPWALWVHVVSAVVLSKIGSAAQCVSVNMCAQS